MGAEMVGVDVGGTFTDVVAIEAGRIVVSKVPTDIVASETSILSGARSVGVGTALVFNLASTAGLNSVLTRRIPKIGFLTTLGHRDILDRGRLGRPWSALTDLSWRRGFGDASRPLVPRYLRRGVHERLTATGDVLVDLDEEQARSEIAVLRSCGVEGIAICLLNAYVNPAHERRLRDIVQQEMPDAVVSISSDVSPLAKEYGRASTTVVDVIMKIKYTGYTDRLATGLADAGFRGTFNYADCAARLMPAGYAMEKPFRLVMGGPAAGTVSSAHFGRLIGDDNVLCADVGGTSTDISVILSGTPWVNSVFELEHDLIVNAISTDITTIGAGGGSIVSISPTGEVAVGPDSAGADPGPACYDRGGARPTMSDTALLAGVLAPDRFLGGAMPLHADLAEAAFLALDTALPLTQRIRYAWNMGLNNIAEGVRSVAIKRGVDTRDLSLFAFGAAGPMLLPALLDIVPLRRVVVPPHPGLFSALGLLSSDQVYSDQRSAYTYLSPDAAESIDELYRSMEADLMKRIGLSGDGAEIRRTFDGRLFGQSWETPSVPVPGGPITPERISELIANFHRAYHQRNGNTFEAFPIQAVTFRIEAQVAAAKVEYPKLEPAPTPTPTTVASTTIRHLYGDDVAAGEYERDHLLAGHVIDGPAVIREQTSTIFVPAGYRAEVGEFGEITIR